MEPEDIIDAFELLVDAIKADPQSPKWATGIDGLAAVYNALRATYGAELADLEWPADIRG